MSGTNACGESHLISIALVVGGNDRMSPFHHVAPAAMLIGKPCLTCHPNDCFICVTTSRVVSIVAHNLNRPTIQICCLSSLLGAAAVKSGSLSFAVL